MTDIPPDAVRMARAVMFDLGADHLRAVLLVRLERIYDAARHGVRFDVLADELREAAALAESDPLDTLRAWLAQLETDARRALETAA